MAKTQIILARHGSTSMNSEGGGSADCVRGWKDLALSPKGVKEANVLAHELQHVHLDAIYTSDLDRAEHTGRVVSKTTGVPLIAALRGLRPWNAGALTGKASSECLPIMLDHIKNKPDTPLPGGESFNTFKDRFLTCLDEIRKKHPNETVCLVTHHRNERLMRGWLDAGGGLNEEIDPDAFLEKGTPPADFVRHTLASGDEAHAAAPRKKSTPDPKYPWSPKPIEPRVRPDNAGLYSQSVGGPLDATGLTRDPIDLKPDVPIRKRSQSWAATVRGSLLE